jgi:lipoate---protein ligase
VGDFNDLPAPVLQLESALRWRRLAEPAVCAAVERSGAAAALGVPDGDLVAAILTAGRQARERVQAAPVRSAGSCYFPAQKGD